MIPLPLKSVKPKLPEVTPEESQKPKRKSKLISRETRHWLHVMLVLVVVIFGLDRIVAAKTVDLAHADAKLDHFYVDPIVKRVMISNKNNKFIQKNPEFVKKFVAWCVDASYKEGLPVELCTNMLRIESKYDQLAINITSGALGPAQFIAGLHTKRLKSEGIIKDSYLELHDMETAIYAWASTMAMYVAETGNLNSAILKYGGWANQPRDQKAQEYLRGARGT